MANKRGRLGGLFPPTLGYACEKMLAAARGGAPVGIGAWAIDQVQALLRSLRDAVTPRDLERSDLLGLALGEAEYAAGELADFFESDEHRLRRPDAGVFAWYLCDRCNALRELAQGLDGEGGGNGRR
jgi:hypothetical protein